ncbi:hypothetical protein FRC12_024517 [Ceratobasidium sp. 428]|nr:hypothetical protein FRC12_024517 [Ceratobasidium sp. 428]
MCTPAGTCTRPRPRRLKLKPARARTLVCTPAPSESTPRAFTSMRVHARTHAPLNRALAGGRAGRAEPASPRTPVPEPVASNT